MQVLALPQDAARRRGDAEAIPPRHAGHLPAAPAAPRARQVLQHVKGGHEVKLVGGERQKRWRGDVVGTGQAKSQPMEWWSNGVADWVMTPSPDAPFPLCAFAATPSQTHCARSPRPARFGRSCTSHSSALVLGSSVRSLANRRGRKCRRISISRRWAVVSLVSSSPRLPSPRLIGGRHPVPPAVPKQAVTGQRGVRAGSVHNPGGRISHPARPAWPAIARIRRRCPPA